MKLAREAAKDRLSTLGVADNGNEFPTPAAIAGTGSAEPCGTGQAVSETVKTEAQKQHMVQVPKYQLGGNDDFDIRGVATQ